MEKLCYALRRRDNEGREAFNKRQLNPVRTDLMRLGVERLKISVQDAELAPGEDLYPDARREAPDALISFWLNSAHERESAEAVLAHASGWMAGYAVLESTVLPVDHRADDGARDDGFTQIAFFSGLRTLSRQEMLIAWLEHHTDVAVQTQSTFQYRQNVVVRALTPGAPAWDCIVEESFPLAALTDPYVFLDAVGSEQKRANNYERLMQSCGRFIDFATMRILLGGDYRFGGWRDSAASGQGLRA